MNWIWVTWVGLFGFLIPSSNSMTFAPSLHVQLSRLCKATRQTFGFKSSMFSSTPSTNTTFGLSKTMYPRRHRIRREQHDGVQRARRVGSCSGCLLGCKYATVGEISLLPESCNTLPSSCYIWLMEWNINIHWHHWWMYLGRQLKKCCLQNNLYMGQQLKFVKKNLKKLFFFFLHFKICNLWL